MLRDQRDDLVSDDHSARYHVDHFRELRKKDVLPPIGVRVKDWKPELLTRSIDLRRRTRIPVYAEEHKLARFHKILVLPKSHYKEKLDYSVEYRDGSTVGVVKILNVKKFENDDFLIAVR